MVKHAQQVSKMVNSEIEKTQYFSVAVQREFLFDVVFCVVGKNAAFKSSAQNVLVSCKT